MDPSYNQCDEIYTTRIFKMPKEPQGHMYLVASCQRSCDDKRCPFDSCWITTIEKRRSKVVPEPEHNSAQAFDRRTLHTPSFASINKLARN